MAYKHDYDKILTRLVTILSRLNDGESLSIKEISEEFNVSTRTIQRDFNERLVSFPIYQENKQWKMREGFKLEKSTSLEDTVVLDIMEGILSFDRGRFSQKAKKLLHKIKNKDYNPIYAKLDIEDISDKLHDIKEIETAIKHHNIISCQYSFESDTKELLLSPLKIANYEGFWYLIAIDNSDNYLKKYYLKNISHIQTTTRTFHHDNKLNTKIDNAISIWFDADAKPFSVTLSVAPKVAKYFKRKPISKSQKIVDFHEDGSLTLSIMITHEMEVMPLVKYWLPHIKVLEPVYIQELIENDIKDYLN